MTPPEPSVAGAEGEPVGSVVQEAFLLFRAMTSGEGAHTTEPSVSDTPRDPGDDRTPDHACSTSWCPVCQVVGFVRDHPDAVTSVSQSAAAFARSLRDLVDAALIPREQK